MYPLERILDPRAMSKDVVEGDQVAKPDEYRQHAAECLHAMQLATVEEVRAVLLLMAQGWHQLADRLEAMHPDDG